MTIKQLFIIDPFEKLCIKNDTSILLMNEVLRKNQQVYSCTEYDISIINNKKIALCHKHEKEINEDILNEKLVLNKYDLEEFDFIHIRKDPPFDESYITLVLMLCNMNHPTVVNNPESILKFNEKLFILMFPEFITDTLVSSSLKEIEEFVRKVGTAVLKPLFKCSGQGIELLKNDDISKQIILSTTNNQKNKVMVQRFLPQVKFGETRVFMFEDIPIAVMKKVPKKDSFKANFAFGVQGEKYELNDKDKFLCKQIGTFCKKHGILLSALDIIDSHISEINITSPGLLVESNKINNQRYEQKIIKLLIESREKYYKRI